MEALRLQHYLQREIAELLPNVTYIEIPRGGHLSLISHAETFNQAMLDWLRQQTASIDSAGGRSSAETSEGLAH